MESGETGAEHVKVPKDSYEKAIKALIAKEENIQALQRKLKAAENLSDLLRRKDDELRQSKESVAELRAVLHKHDALWSREMSERSATQHGLRPSEPVANTPRTLESDGDLTRVLKTDDVVADSAASFVSHMVDRKCVPQRAELKAAFKSSGSLRKSSPSVPQLNVALPVQPCLAALAHTSSTSSSLPCCTSDFPSSSTFNSISLPVTSAISKDLIDKVMQQNARLKKAIRDVLMQKGLSVSDYLEKREYEDAIQMLRQEVKRHENTVIQLQAIINSRDSGEIDQLSQKCSDLTTTVSQLERRLALQGTYVQEANKRLQRVEEAASTNVENKATDATCEDLKRVNELLEELHEVKTQVAELNEAKQQESEQVLELRKQHEDMQSVLRNTTERLATKEDALARVQKLYDDVEAEKHVLKSQLMAYEEDFNVERKEKMEQKEKYENLIVQRQEWIRQLASEGLSLRKSLEKAEKDLRESQLRNSRMFPQSCASQDSMAAPEPVHLPILDVIEDGDNDTPIPKRVLECPRCQREFNTQEKLSQHCEKCVDE